MECVNFLSEQSLVMHQTLKGESLPVFKEWLRTATSNGNPEGFIADHIIITAFCIERDLLLEMLHAAHEDSEEARLAKVKEIL